MKIQLTQDTLDKAKQKASEFEALNIEGKEKHIFKTENNLDKKRIGFIGELAFESYLKERKIEYEKDDILFKADKFDFKIGGKTIDIKTTYYLPYSNTGKVFLNKIQTERKQIDIYVFAVIHMDKLEILGYLKKEDMKNLHLNETLQSPAYEIQKEDLKKVREIL